MAIGKRRKYSKKSKRNWRKFTEVKDVEEYLEDVRKDERTGGPIVNKSDQQLFFVHTREGGPSAVARRGGRRRWKPLRCEANLYPSEAGDLEPTGGRGEAAVSSRFDSSDEEYNVGSDYKRVLKRRRRHCVATQQKNAKLRIQPTTGDLWTEEVAMVDCNPYLEATVIKPVKMPNTMKRKPSALQSVELPAPGTSYNPTFHDHQELLRAAVEVEERKEREIVSLEKKLKFTPMSQQEREKAWLEEMTQGLPGDKEEDQSEEEEGSKGEGEADVGPLARGDKRKTRKQRRKERERREEHSRKVAEKLRKRRMEEVYRLKALRREVLKIEEKKEEKMNRRALEKAESVYTTKLLGRHRYEEPDIDVQLSSEVAGSLLSLKPEGSIAADRYKSLQKRNIIEPREIVKKQRKYRLKTKEKRCKRD